MNAKATFLFWVFFWASRGECFTLKVSASGRSKSWSNDLMPFPPTAIAMTSTSNNQNTDPSLFFYSTPDTETTASDCDNINRPPSLSILVRSIQALASTGNCDIRGRFLDHSHSPGLSSINNVAYAIAKVFNSADQRQQPVLTPLAAHCLGQALAQFLIERRTNSKDTTNTNRRALAVVIGQDPRLHGMRIVDAVARGIEFMTIPSDDESAPPQPAVLVFYTGLASTPACSAFLSLQSRIRRRPNDDTKFNQSSVVVEAAIMVTASHLPPDRNGLKIYFRDPKAGVGICATNQDIARLGSYAVEYVTEWFTAGKLPSYSGKDAVRCSQRVDWMPEYAEFLKETIRREIFVDRGIGNDDINASGTGVGDSDTFPLQGLKIILNAGNACGGFLAQVLEDLGADALSHSLHLEPDGTFPHGVPNPEYAPMINATLQQCRLVHADLAIMLDTDADRCGFVVPNKNGSDYEPLHRNRLIALLGVVFAKSSPGCAIVTDSVTSEGLSIFLQDKLGLQHVRHIKGYANVISRAKELTESGVCNAELAIETSGHCAMKENNYLDDGTYTAVKVVSLLVRQRRKQLSESLLDLIADMEELDEIVELRMSVMDKSLDTMRRVFETCVLIVERHCRGIAEVPDTSRICNSSVTSCWVVDPMNLDGIRLRVGDGQFFMMRPSLHDPIISMQVEAKSKQHARDIIVKPLLQLFHAEQSIQEALDLSILANY